MEKNSNEAAALAMFKLGVAAHTNRNKGSRFIPSRYPYTYAADFLRSHVELVPAWLRDHLDGSRGAASKVRQRWAEHLGIDDRAAAEVLAQGYISENNVQDVPAELDPAAR